MDSPASSSAKRIAVSALLVAAVGAVGYTIGTESLQLAPATDVAALADPGSAADEAHSPGASATESPPLAVARPGVEIAPPTEEGPLIPMIPGLRESVGHRAGLHKVKDELRLSASAALVLDQDTGEAVYRKNDEAVLPIASLTKLMTGLVVTEAKLPMDEAITITEDDVDAERHSRSRLRVGTSLTRGEALHVALMSSENRAAHALGRTYPGGLGAFVAAMNRKAKALGMKSTTYVDPTGLSSSNQSSARDLAALADVASKNPLLAGYSTDRQHLLPVASGRLLQYNNSNRLIKNPQWEIELQKTGYIVEAGWCLILDTKIAGRNLLLVLLDAGSGGNRVADAERIKRMISSRGKLAVDAPEPVAVRTRG